MLLTMSGNDIDMDLLLSLIKERPVIWDRALDIYKSKGPTSKAWKEICQAQFPNYHSLTEDESAVITKAVQNKWANVRDYYTKWQKRYKDHIEVGANPDSMKKYIYHKKLVFLNKSTSETRQKRRKTSHQQSQEEPAYDDAGGSEISPQPRNLTQVKEELEDDGLSSSQNNFMTAAELALRYERNADTHLSFFKGIIPSITDFDTEETLQFQMDVLHAIKNIKNLRSQNPNSMFHY